MDTQFKAMHAEVRAIAHAVMRKERVAHTLETDALVSELYLRICNSGLPDWTAGDDDAYVRWCRLLIKHTLMDHARGRLRQKRGGGLRRAPPVVLDGLAARTAAGAPSSLMAEVRAILEDGVARDLISRQQAAIFMLGTFFQLKTKEVAEQMDIPLRTVQHVLSMTRAYVAAELERRGG